MEVLKQVRVRGDEFVEAREIKLSQFVINGNKET